MKPIKTGRYRLLSIMLLTALLGCVFTYLYLSCDILSGDDERVTVFIIDSEFDKPYGHGKMIRQVIAREAGLSRIINLDIGKANGSLSDELYLGALERILTYKKLNSDRVVLVNISLAFRDKKFQKDLITRLYRSGVLIIAAAGNNNSEKPIFPAGFSEEVVAVASAVEQGKAASSNYGKYIDIAAPGNLEFFEQLFFPGYSYRQRHYFTGTSFAAPRVTGLLARLLHLSSGMEPAAALDLLKRTAQPIEDPLFEEGKLGAGIISKEGALAYVDQYYYHIEFLIRAVLIISLLLLMAFLWPRFGLISIFIFILLALVAIPLFMFIGMNYPGWLRWLKEVDLMEAGVVILPVLLALFVIKEFTKRYITKNSNIKTLYYMGRLPFPGIKRTVVQRLKQLAEADAGWVRRALIHSSPYQNFIIENLLDDRLKEDVIPVLINLLKSNNPEKGGLAVRAFGCFSAQAALSHLEKLLAVPEADTYLVLKAIVFFGHEASYLKERVTSIIQESSEMWTRYQALLTLKEIDIEGEDFRKMLQELKDDPQELVRLEANYHWNQLNRD